MKLEARIEREGCIAQRQLGALDCIKIGWDSWPDRLVLLGNGRHYWCEWKAEKGRLRAGQEERIRQLRAAGEIVFAPRSLMAGIAAHREAEEFMERARVEYEMVPACYCQAARQPHIHEAGGKLWLLPKDETFLRRGRLVWEPANEPDLEEILG